MNRTVEIKLFGALRKYAPGGRLQLPVAPETLVAGLRERLRHALRERDAAFTDDGLLDATAFADDERVLRDEEPLDERMRVSALPPVCGG